MALKITCPHCGTVRRLDQPYPLPGTELQCNGCGRGLAISYPKGMVDRMRSQGVRFEDPFAQDPFAAESDQTEIRPMPVPAPAPQGPGPLPAARPRASSPPPSPRPPPPARTDPAADFTTLEPRGPGPSDRTEALSDPSGAMAGAGEPTGTVPLPPPGLRAAPALPSPDPTRPLPAPAGAPGPAAAPGGPRKQAAPRKEKGRPPAAPRRKASTLVRLLRLALVLGLLALVGGSVLGFGALQYFGRDLPTVDALSTYEPPTVTVVNDRHGELLGEIYEKRRYVVPLEQVPQHVVDAFIAAEDANFYAHDGVDYMGIVRAVLRNAAKGKKAQGASTITQQVARNFLLSSEKTYERKIREILLSRRIEDTFDKQHILYLYLNQIYLGSGAYGVEAASRTYFDKHVQDISLAEAAILAGLPQRPSDYSPHRNWEKARNRQEYALGQMRDKDFIDQATYEAALAEVVQISPRDDGEFFTQAPYFTEHIRRYLVETYGFDKIYNDGLTVQSTCDLPLQRAAQAAVTDGVLKASNSIGWRGATEQLAEADIAPRLEQIEQALREAQSQEVLRVAALDGGQGGFDPLPAQARLVAGRRYDGVVLEVKPEHAVVGVGQTRVLVPIEWSQWLYRPDPNRSFKARVQRDLSAELARGDLIVVQVEALDHRTVDELRSHQAAFPKAMPAARIYQAPEIEGALLSYRFSDGAVLAMVGGYDFKTSEFNRATQAMRQVGSTFKPIVYAAAIATRQFTAGSLVQDAPTVFGVLGYGLYKPGNYGQDFLGSITLRKALQLSRNVVTVRVLDRIGLEPVYQFAGPTLRIGYDEPRCSRTHVKADSECPGTMTPSNVKGMAWCEHCDPNSCSFIRVEDEKRCMAPAEDRDGERWCRSCDVSLRACSWVPRTQLGPADPCQDARLDETTNEVVCRACDLSVGLGSSSLTMLELARAYTVFGTQGRLVEPHWIDRVVDRDGTVIEEYAAPDPWPQVMDPAVAGIGHWLLREVATGGTAAKSNRLGIQVAGKTGTTNDFKDAWFVGYNSELIAASWVGYDRPESLGQSFTGGDTALPIWMDYMTVAAPKEADKPFPAIRGVEMVPIDEATGRVARGGRAVPMLPGTAPDNVVGDIGQKTAEDLLTTDF